MTNIAMPDDGLELPPFLVVTAAEQARRIEYNKAHPIAAQPFIPPTKPAHVPDEEWEVREAERKAREKAASYDRLNKMFSNKEAKAAREDGKIWKAGKWVRPDGISQASAQRIMSELPTDSMRQIFVDRYGHRVNGGIQMPKRKGKKS